MSGGAEFKVAYSAIVYRPFRGEVVDGIVASVNKVCFVFCFFFLFAIHLGQKEAEGVILKKGRASEEVDEMN